MSDYIEREAAFDAVFGQFCASSDETEAALNAAIEEIRAIPAADVRPVVRAQIIDMRYVEEDGEWKCSRCGWQYTLCVCGKDVTSKIHFCPNCGADMRPTSMSGANGEER